MAEDLSTGLPGCLLFHLRAFGMISAFFFLASVHSQLAQELPEYGIMFYRVASEKSLESPDRWVGVCLRGVVVAEVRQIYFFLR